MLQLVPLLLSLTNGYKTYASVILAVVSGLGMILSKNYGEGLAEIFQALTLVFSGASVMSLRHAVSKMSRPL
jgi:nucleoside permease NupC